MDSESIIGDWVRQKILGSGSFGVVSLWRRTNSEEELAVKICKWGNDTLTAKHRMRWTTEVEMMNSIKNDNIVGTKEIPLELANGLVQSNISNLPILCMEYCNEGDLRQMLNLPKNSNGLPELEVRCILNDMKSAISHLHRLNITHRDLKPENIVLHNVHGKAVNNSSMERNFVYKLIDLGYAKEIGANSVCASFVGTLQYLAPELLYSKSYSNTVDYWSFGLVAFEVICGIRPFLPNMAPVQWMTHVKLKTPDQICAFEQIDGQIKFSPFLFSENYITSCFKESIEQWLKLALEWDPKKRGHKSEEKSVKFNLPGEDDKLPKLRNDSVEIFTLLDNILTKKIIKIFSVSTYEFLSYEIDESTLFITLQKWIERDISVPITEQVFINPKSEQEVDLSGTVLKYWNNQFSEVVYVYHIDSLIKDNINPKIPATMKYCYNNPKCDVPYFYYLSILYNCFHSMSIEQELFDTLIKAYVLKIESLKSAVKKLEADHNNSDKLMMKLLSKHYFLSDILTVDDERMPGIKHELIASEYQSWFCKIKPVSDNIIKLKDAFSQLTMRVQSVVRRTNEINEKDIDSKLNTDELIYMQKITSSLITKTRMIPKESRQERFSCVNALRLFHKFLKLHVKLLYNLDTKKIGQKIMDIFIETRKMSALIVSMGINADDFSKELSHLMIERENLMWTFVENSTPVNEETSHLACTLPKFETYQSSGNSTVNFKIGDAVRSTSEDVPTRNTDELESIIKDNVCLRMLSENFILKSHQDSKNIFEDIFSDFNCL